MLVLVPREGCLVRGLVSTRGTLLLQMLVHVGGEADGCLSGELRRDVGGVGGGARDGKRPHPTYTLKWRRW